MNAVLHIVPDPCCVANGMAVAARLVAREQGAAEVVDLMEGIRRVIGPLSDVHKTYSEVWLHGMWLPREWLVCWKTIRSSMKLVRMLHGSLSPVYLERQSPLKKRLVGPIEKWCLRRCAKIVATCEAEKRWIEAYLGRKCPPVEIVDMKRYFHFETERSFHKSSKCLHILYLGRRHPLKGVEYIERAVDSVERGSDLLSTEFALRIVSDAFGEELEEAWNWCDVLVLPTLSDNFGLVIAEALERGKRVITTDGAPAWGDGLVNIISGGPDDGLWTGYGGRLIYIKGFREGTDEQRVRKLQAALMLSV